jgi:hypothetical protein
MITFKSETVQFSSVPRSEAWNDVVRCYNPQTGVYKFSETSVMADSLQLSTKYVFVIITNLIKHFCL